MEEVIIDQWAQIAELEIEFPSEYFRGQADANWPISSSLQRSMKGSDFETELSNIEYWLLRRFKRGAGRYLESLPEDDDVVSWLSLMQHHGTPTRLIDFTRSFYVAMYFALSGTSSDSAVWAIDPFFLFDVVDTLSGEGRVGLRDEWDDSSTRFGNRFLGSLLKTASSASGPADASGVIAVEPCQFHNRLSIQQGIFLMPLDLQLDLIGNLLNYESSCENPIRKIIIKENLIETGLAHLRAMNITAETLFPGIDGFAKSLVHQHLCRNS